MTIRLPVIITFLTFFTSTSLKGFAQEDMLSQKVSINCQSCNLQQLFEQIESVSSIRINYKSKDIPENYRLTVTANQPIKDFLKDWLKPVHLSFQHLGKGLVVIKKEPWLISKNRIRISGYVRDNESSEVLIGAVVLTSTGQYVYTNDFGYFNISLPIDTATLTIHYIGYEICEVKILTPRDKFLTIKLRQNNALSEVVISGNPDSLLFIDDGVSISFDQNLLKKLPSLLGEGDAFNSLSLLPGVQSIRDISPGIFVRGGGPDQNLVLMDGVPVYNPTHLFGVLSVFDPSGIKNVKVYKDAFPANYGDRLSSVIDVKTHDGNLNKVNGSVSIGLLSSGILVEGPIKKNKTSFLISARRSYADLILSGINLLADRKANSKSNTGYYFYDFNARFQHHFNKHSNVKLLLYNGADNGFIKNKLKLNDETNLRENSSVGLNWNNMNGVVRWNYAPGKGLFSNFTVFYARYQIRFSDKYSFSKKVDGVDKSNEYSFIYKSGIADLGIKEEFDILLNEKNSLKIGGAFTRHQFNPGNNSYSYKSNNQVNLDTISGYKGFKSFDASFFAQHIYTLKNKWNVQSGVRHSSYFINNKIWYIFQPRFALSYKPSKRLQLLVDAARMAQFIHLLPNNNLGLPIDVWFPVTDKLMPFISNQASAGLKYSTGVWNIATEAFYKQFRNILEFRDGANLVLSSTKWEQEVVKGDGRAFGWEQLVQYKKNAVSAWLTYTLSKSERLFKEINNGKWFPYKYDHRHQVSLAGVYQINYHLSVSAAWIYLSGNPVTIPENRYFIEIEGKPFPVEILGPRNNYRMPDYHRLDLGCSYTKKKKWGESIWTFSIYNAYNQMNPYYLYFGFNQYGQRVLRQRSLLPVIPSATYTFRLK